MRDERGHCGQGGRIIPGRASRGKEEVQQIKLEIERIRSLSVENLRLLWQQKFERRVPAALSKDLISRMLCFKVQEEVFGSFDRATLKRLDACANGKKGGAKQAAHLRAGTELIREYQGERLKVIVTEDGFVFKGKNYSSLTSIARSVTGTNWNGPKFFGLRAKDEKASTPIIPPVGGGVEARAATGASI